MSIEGVIFTISITLITVIITIIITRHYSFRSKLNFIIFSIVDLVKLSRIAKDKVNILYNSKPVDSLSVIRIIVKNQGNIDISREQIRKKPSITFIDSVKIIDVEEIDKDINNEIIPEINNEENEIIFDIQYLKRKEKASFQILVHKEKGESVDYDDIKFISGIIKNTSTKLINFGAERFPKYLNKTIRLLIKHPKLLTLFYFTFSFILFIQGVFALLYSLINVNIYQIFGLKVPEGTSIFSATFLIFMSIMISLPFIGLYKRIKYRNAFNKTKE